MSIYYNFKYKSSEPLVAEVKEMLRSYFSSGIIDDVLFPKWIEFCLGKLRKTTFRIQESVLQIQDYQACLPDDFNSVREAWLCTTTAPTLYQDPSSIYYQKECRVDVVERDKCDPCFLTEDCTTDYLVTHKRTGMTMFSFKRTFLLKPGNINTKKHCAEDCINLYSNAADSFDIHNGNFVCNFPEGCVNLVYYAYPEEDGERLIPDDLWIEDYIRKYLIFKCFEQLSNVVTDETFNQIDRKKQEAKQDMNEAFVAAESESKKETIDAKMRAIKASYNRNQKYNISGDQSHVRRSR
jgi:hypothetical protein